MALIRQANAREIVREAIVLDLGDVQRQGEALIESARRQSAAIVQEAGAERLRLIQGASEQGREAGFAKGLAEGHEAGAQEGRAAALSEHREALESLQKGWAAALSDFCARRERLFADSRSDVLKLSAAIAEKVVKRRVQLDETVVAAQLGAVLAIIARPTELLISINPADRTAAESALPSLMERSSAARHVEFVDDAALARGSCIARTRDAHSQERAGDGEIDASIGTQLDRIVAALLPEPESGLDAAPADAPGCAP